MRVRVKMYRQDLLENHQELFVDTVGILKDDQLSYFENDKKTKHVITFKDDRVVIERYGDVSTFTTLCTNVKSECLIRSEYGDMVLQTETENITRTKDKWIVAYRVLSDRDVVLHQRIRWELSERIKKD